LEISKDVRKIFGIDVRERYPTDVNASVYVGTLFETSDCAEENIQSAQRYVIFVFILIVGYRASFFK